MKYLIIPDVHGREFWKYAKNVVKNDNYHIIFLGDYLDPYGFENISGDKAVDNFQEIIDFKKEYPEKITLLFGNHDIHYLPELRFGYKCRCIKSRYDDIQKMFEDNIKLFKIAKEVKIGDKNILFTHAGLQYGWYQNASRQVDFPLTVDGLNSLLDIRQGIFALSICSIYRGGRDRYGSVLWADINEHLDAMNENTESGLSFSGDARLPWNYQIFAHSLGYPDIDDYVILPTFAMLDCRACFELDEEGQLHKIEQ